MKRKIYRFLSTERWSDSAVFFMRIFVGVLMLIHGIGKINNYEKIGRASCRERVF